MAEKPYSRIYHRLMTEYPTVWRTPSQLGLWVQLLVLAEKFYPDSAPPQHKTRAYRALVSAGLVQEDDSGGYTIKGLEAERERRSAIGRNAASVRYQRERTALAMLDETRIDKKETSNGQSQSTTFMRYPVKKVASVPSPIDLADIERQQAASLADAIRKTAEREAGA